ncbi:flagellar brake protein [Fundidesulfovibrio butyratiphilus]
MSTSAGKPTQQAQQLKKLDGDTLDIEAGARVMLEPNGVGRRIWAEFIGMKRGRFLILQPPLSLEMRDLLRPDEEVTVRFAHRAYQVCGFKAWITRFITQPAHLLFITYPPSYEALSMRRYTRCASVLPVAIRYGSHEAQGVIVNLSRGGCRVALKIGEGGPTNIPQQDDEVFLSFSITGELQDIHTKALVRSQTIDKEKVSVGVQFADLPEPVSRAIGEFIEDFGEDQGV